MAFPSKIFASEVPPNAISLSDEIYADLAVHNNLDHVSLYYFDGNIDNTVSVNPDKTWDPASTVKLYVAMYTFDQVAAGKISLDQLVTITDQNIAPGVSVENGYSPLTSGQEVTVYELLDRMITQSGNTSYNTLLELLDRRQVTKYVHDLGLVNSSIGAKLNLDDSQEAIDSTVPGFGPNVTNADDFARAFILINGKRIPGSPSLFDMLSRQKLNSMIPADLPKNVVVAHKTGELDPYYHDGGIVVDQSRNYILSVFTDAGDPNIVAHISDLIYTKDINLVGSDFTLQSVSETPDQPIDPIVADGEIVPNVLAASTSDVKLPVVTASDLGINPSDLSYILDSSQLPRVIIPADSPFHFLVDWGDKITSLYPAIPSLYIAEETGKLKLSLAEAKDLMTRKKSNDANLILRNVDLRVANLAKEKIVSQDSNLQKDIESISQTRFALLKSELGSASGSSKISVIKEIASQAKNEVAFVKPFVKGATEARALSQQPLIGQVVSSTPTSLTLKTSDGSQVTVPMEASLRTKSADKNIIKTENATQLAVGSQVALVGASADKKIKPFFVLTNIPTELGNPKPVTVIKVNTSQNTVVVAGENGVPVQIDLTKNTAISGSDTSIALGEIKAGDIIVVHGIPISTPVKNTTQTSFPTSTPLATLLPGGNTSSTPGVTTGKSNGPPGSSASVVTAPTPLVNTQPTKRQNTPEVIKGTVIEVVQEASDSKPRLEKKE